MSARVDIFFLFLKEQARSIKPMLVYINIKINKGKRDRLKQ